MSKSIYSLSDCTYIYNELWYDMLSWPWQANILRMNLIYYLYYLFYCLAEKVIVVSSSFLYSCHSFLLASAVSTNLGSSNFCMLRLKVSVLKKLFSCCSFLWIFVKTKFQNLPINFVYTFHKKTVNSSICSKHSFWY